MSRVTVETESGSQPADPWRKPTTDDESIEEPLPTWRDQSGTASLLAGLIAVSALGVIVGFAFPLGAWYARSAGAPASFTYRLAFIWTLFFPTLSVATFAVVAPMFCPGSMLRRVLFTFVTLVPGGFVAGIMFWLTDGRDQPYALPMFYFFLGLFYGAGTVTVLTQMITPWSLTPARNENANTPPFGLGTLIQFTALIAVGFGLFALPVAEEYLRPV
ncbi:MAG: hypothetical protein AAFU85_02905, partial [Planctomycetota bacterium]